MNDDKINQSGREWYVNVVLGTCTRERYYWSQDIYVLCYNHNGKFTHNDHKSKYCL